jgi:putative endonuclease
MVYVYLIECGDGSLYTGIAKDLHKRLAQHVAGKGAKYTRGRGPLHLRYVELQPDKPCALRRELEIKRLTREQKWKLFERICLLDQAHTMR